MNRDEFYSNLAAMYRASQEVLLIDQTLQPSPENQTANLLRKGLAIAAYASLESHLEHCFGRLVAALGTCKFAYNEFSPSLKKFLTIEAISGLGNRLYHVPKIDRLSFAEAGINSLSAHSSSPPSYVVYGFSPRGSNVSSEDLTSALQAFGVVKPWDRMADICSSIGDGRLSLSSDYSALAAVRHLSAHNAQSTLPTDDLQTHIRSAVILGIATDILTCLISAGIQRSHAFSDSIGHIARAIPELRFVDQEIEGTWAERASSAGVIVKRYATEEAAIHGASSRANASFIVCRDPRRIPTRLV